jgi:hypothetical protein
MNKNFYIDSTQMTALSDKISGMTRWLAENAPYCAMLQKHLDEGTAERAYWHYGYLCALKDIVSAINRSSAE